MTDQYLFDAFGELLASVGDTPNEYLYTGEQYDPNLGFYHLRARYYNPSIGRFHTLDTWMGSPHDPITLHKYLYAHANPVMHVDPSGQFSMLDIAAANVIRSILTEVHTSSLSGFLLVYESGGSESKVFKNFGIAAAASIATAVVIRVGFKVIQRVMKIRSMQKVRNWKGQLNVDCSDAARDGARFFGLNPSELVPMNSSRPGIIMPLGPNHPGGSHFSLRLPGGEIYDPTILWNIQQRNRGVMPKGLESLVDFDSFSKETYDELLRVLVDVAKLNP